MGEKRIGVSAGKNSYCWCRWPGLRTQQVEAKSKGGVAVGRYEGRRPVVYYVTNSAFSSPGRTLVRQKGAGASTDEDYAANVVE